MKKFNKVSMVVLLLVFMFGLALPNDTFAATSPALVGSAGYSVLGATTVTCTGATTVTGNVGVAAGTAITGFPSPCTVTPGTTQSNTPSAIAAQADNLSAFGDLNAGANADANCIGGVLPSGTDLSALSPLGPGVYCSSGTFSLTGNLNLTGSGVWVFKMASALNTSPGSSVTGGDACNVWWRVGSTATLGTTTSFEGNILALTSVVLNSGAILSGRAMAQTGAVTLNANTISGPTCLVPPVPPAGVSSSGGGPLVSQIPPIINVTKIPTPLALPGGPGSVTYDYTVLNVGAIPINNVKLIDNSCSPVGFISGDTNSNGLLDVTETWHYRCNATLSQTTTNTVVATGNANGYTATDTANATVVVGLPTVPPLIHLLKIPNVFILPVSGGVVTYTYRVTNPGTVALSNVNVVDNKCSPVGNLSGDTNGNNMLDVGETWIYTCQTNLTSTTTNTATAQGSANGFTVTDSSLATVAVVTPVLPRTGFPPKEDNNLWSNIFQKLYSFFF